MFLVDSLTEWLYFQIFCRIHLSLKRSVVLLVDEIGGVLFCMTEVYRCFIFCLNIHVSRGSTLGWSKSHANLCPLNHFVDYIRPNIWNCFQLNLSFAVFGCFWLILWRSDCTFKSFAVFMHPWRDQLCLCRWWMTLEGFASAWLKYTGVSWCLNIHVSRGSTLGWSKSHANLCPLNLFVDDIRPNIWNCLGFSVNNCDVVDDRHFSVVVCIKVSALLVPGALKVFQVLQVLVQTCCEKLGGKGVLHSDVVN